jgi:hypothetical protein
MRKTVLSIVALAALGLMPSAGPAAAADVKVGITIDVPPPPVVLAPPPLVLVTGTPVHHVPSASFNLFVYQNRYYSHHNGAWFAAAGPRAPWKLVAVEAVPRPVLVVPAKHYKIPPGQAKKMAAAEGGWCPPGQAKKGRC